MTLKTQIDIGLLRVTIDAGVSIEVYQQRRLVRVDLWLPRHLQPVESQHQRPMRLAAPVECGLAPQ